MLKNLKPKIKSSFLIAYLVVLSVINSAAAADPAEEFTVITALTLNLARFTEWPNSLMSNESEIRLCVIGDNVMQQAFDRLDSMPVGTKTYKIGSFNAVKKFHAMSFAFYQRSR
ncbi:MAG: DUF4154 domain-containing protein [Methylococcaceae bacterium]|nr:DUF4154 domain-containing protein [Methylococcaceae bacterium]